MTMDKGKLAEVLNTAIGWELAGLLQYNQYAQVLLGEDRKIWHGFFEEMSDESLSHARKFAKRVVALGGKPNAEPEAVKQTSDLTEMLENSLTLEQRLVEIYSRALDIAKDNTAYRNLLEDHIQAENDDCEELMIYLRKVENAAASGKRGRRAS